MTVLIAEVIREVREIKADFLFGFYPYAPCWYYDALIRGSGTPELPCLFFASPEYSGGYMADPLYTFFGDVPTPAGMAHLRSRNLAAMYAGWQGRGALPEMDHHVFHAGASSLRFEPSAAGAGPRSPYIDRKLVPAATGRRQEYMLSCWVKAADAGDIIRFWVGQANGSQYPGYMYYTNYALTPNQEWMQLHTLVRHRGPPPLVVRFWCPPTRGTVWLDDVVLQPMQERLVTIPIGPPPDGAEWATIDWRLAPADARYDASIIDPQDGRRLRMRLNRGDSLAPLTSIVA